MTTKNFIKRFDLYIKNCSDIINKYGENLDDNNKKYISSILSDIHDTIELKIELSSIDYNEITNLLNTYMTEFYIQTMIYQTILNNGKISEILNIYIYLLNEIYLFIKDININKFN